MAEQSTGTLEVELPGTGWAVTDVGAQLVFMQEFEAEFDRLMTACGDYPDITTAEIRAELARRQHAAEANA